MPGGILIRPSLVLGFLSVLLMLVGSSDAEHCTTYSTSNPEVTDPVFGFYIDNDICQFDCLFSIWIYQESNGIPGLQRGDEVVDDTCHGMIESDTFPCSLLPIALLTPRERNAKARKAANGAALAGLAFVGATAFAPTADAC